MAALAVGPSHRSLEDSCISWEGTGVQARLTGMSFNKIFRFTLPLLGTCLLLLSACGSSSNLSAADTTTPPAEAPTSETSEAENPPQNSEAPTADADDDTIMVSEPYDPDQEVEVSRPDDTDDTDVVEPPYTPDEEVEDVRETEQPEQPPVASEAFCEALEGFNSFDDADPAAGEETKQVMDELVGYADALVASAPVEFLEGAQLWQRVVVSMEAALIEYDYNPEILDDDELFDDIVDLTDDEIDVFIDFRFDSDDVCGIS